MQAYESFAESKVHHDNFSDNIRIDDNSSNLLSTEEFGLHGRYPSRTIKPVDRFSGTKVKIAKKAPTKRSSNKDVVEECDEPDTFVDFWRKQRLDDAQKQILELQRLLDITIAQKGQPAVFAPNLHTTPTVVATNLHTTPTVVATNLRTTPAVVVTNQHTTPAVVATNQHSTPMDVVPNISYGKRQGNILTPNREPPKKNLKKNQSKGQPNAHDNLRLPDTRDYHRQADALDHHRQADALDYNRQPDARDYHRQPDTRDYHRQPDTLDHHRQPDTRDYRRQPDTRDYHQQPDVRDYHRQADARDYHRQADARDYHHQAPAQENQSSCNVIVLHDELVQSRIREERMMTMLMLQSEDKKMNWMLQGFKRL